MTLTLAEVEHIAQLARLELTAEEKTRYREQLSAILDYAASLQALDTSGVEPGGTGPDLDPTSSNLRPDASRPGLERPVALENAPQVENGQFRVPPVLE